MAEKNYIKGSAREFTFSNGGSNINLSLSLDALTAIANDKGYVNITVAPRQEADRYGNTHSVFENTYKPDEKKTPVRSAAKPQNTLTPPKFDDKSDDLPF